MSDSNHFLALYDFASKQEYIYRTSKIKEISGASELLSTMYRKFVDVLSARNFKLEYDIEKDFNFASFSVSDVDGEVLYDGGGNLMVLFKSKERYIDANKIISVYLLKNVPGLTLVACGVESIGDFKLDRSRLYEENSTRKNQFPAYCIPAVTPVTQIDPLTFMPVVSKESYPEKISLSADRVAKRKAYLDNSNNLSGLDEGLLAVIYIDGNSMGNKLTSCESSDYNDGVKKLRSFSKQVNQYYVVEPLKKLKKAAIGAGFRRVIGGGDEITVICRAESALELVKIYFDELNRKTIQLGDQMFKCTSCAGIAVFHAKSPFDVAYNIAEAACESAKCRAHEEDGNYLDFYYCHAGITSDFDTLRLVEQSHATARPYSIEEITNLDGLVSILKKAGRSNVKALGNAAQSGEVAYKFEVERVNAYLPSDCEKLNGDEAEMRNVYDISEFYDLWFSFNSGESEAQ